MKTQAERFWAKVHVADGCWNWLAYCNPQGYARFAVNGKALRIAHAARFLYEIIYGALPEGYEPDHLCGNTACVRPDHIEAVTKAENRRRQRNWLRDKRRCPQGHLYSGKNLAGSRICRACKRKQNGVQ